MIEVEAGEEETSKDSDFFWSCESSSFEFSSSSGFEDGKTADERILLSFSSWMTEAGEKVERAVEVGWDDEKEWPSLDKREESLDGEVE